MNKTPNAAPGGGYYASFPSVGLAMICRNGRGGRLRAAAAHPHKEARDRQLPQLKSYRQA